MYFNELSDQQVRVLVDLRQVYQAWSDADDEARQRFSGSMFWRQVKGKAYLKRKIGRVEKSLGPRSAETEQTYRRFMEGRQAVRDRLGRLGKALDTQAAMARAIGLGRVSRVVARLLRQLEKSGVLGYLRVVGTHALYAYEALAGVHFMPGTLATTDIDLLADARRRLRIMVPEREQRTLLGVLRGVDKSFSPVPGKPYRVVNAEGFMVDLICQESKPPWRDAPGADPLAEGDLVPASIHGLHWLVNAPLLRTITIDQRGYPVPIVVPDPRMWMLHKLWLAEQPGRDPEKRRRDRHQAEAVHRLLVRHLLQYPLDEPFAAGLPGVLRRKLGLLPSNQEDGAPPSMEPGW